jgi:hypothetical protein
MATDPVYRQYVALRASKSLLDVYRATKNADALKDKTLELLSALGAGERFRGERVFTAGSAPSNDWTLEVVDQPPGAPEPNELIVSYDFYDSEQLEQFRTLIQANLNKRIGSEAEDAFLGVGADPGGDIADHWCPGAGSLAAFGRRADARRVLGIDALEAVPPSGTQGSGSPKVNVVIIDQGLNMAAIQSTHPYSWGGGWRHGNIAPGSAERTSHGMLIARNVLDVAPDAVVYDMPLIPKPIITRIPLFASDADAAYHYLLLCIYFLRQFPRWSGPWVLVNAWAIFDRSSEHPLGDYTENTNPQLIGHRLNNIIASAALQDHVDVVFAAGNCGGFCPAPRCGKVDRGPGRSIWGANSSSAVITVGAVLTNETWLGYSSQGPGQTRLGDYKPDFCAPSQFSETTDASVSNTGTSAACGLTAGVVAALRKRWDASRVPPQTLKQVLIDTTRKSQGPEWNGRLGYGVLNAGDACKRLSIDFPLAPNAVAQAPSGVTQTSNEAPQTSWLARILARWTDLMRRNAQG